MFGVAVAVVSVVFIVIAVVGCGGGDSGGVCV